MIDQVRAILDYHGVIDWAISEEKDFRTGIMILKVQAKNKPKQAVKDLEKLFKDDEIFSHHPRIKIVWELVKRPTGMHPALGAPYNPENKVADFYGRIYQDFKNLKVKK